MSDSMIDLVFVATDSVELEVLMDEQRFFDCYYRSDEVWFESSFIDSYERLANMLRFIFNTDVAMRWLFSENGKGILDLTSYKEAVISEIELDKRYDEWLEIVGRENNMDEYGSLCCVAAYIRRSMQKNHLLLIAETRKGLN